MTVIGGISLPDDFIASLLSFQKYPLFIVGNSPYGPGLTRLRERLTRKKARLFSHDAENIVIPIREVDKAPDGQLLVTKRNLLSEDKLKGWIGDTYEQEPTNPAKFSGALATKPDPICRFM